MRSLIIIISIILIGFVNNYSQKIFTLEDALSIALENSYSIKSAEYSLLNSSKNLEAAKLGLRSNVNLEIDLPRYTSSLSSQFNPSTGTEEFFDIGNTTVESRLSINQPIPFTNGTISFRGSIFGREQFNEASAPRKDYFSNFSINLRQPIFTFNTQLASLERAEINIEKAKRSYTRSEREIIYNVTASFFNLTKSKRNVQISEEKVRQNEVQNETAVNKYKAGLIAEVDALQLEIDLAQSRNELLDAERSFEEAKNDFKLLIGLELNEQIDIKAEIDYRQVQINEDELLTTALKNRPDLKNLEADLELKKMNIDEVDSRNTIKAELVANYGVNKNDPQFSGIFNELSDNKYLALTLTVPIWDWGKNSVEVEAAEVELKRNRLDVQNQEKLIVNEIKSAIGKLRSAKQRYDILNKSLQLAEKSYNISLERFKAGNITSFELSQAQLRFTNAKVSDLNALVDYNLAIADLERKTFTEVVGK